MDRTEFMALDPQDKADKLNMLIGEGKTQKEAMDTFGITIKDLMATQVLFSKAEGVFISKAVGGFSNFHSDTTADAAK